MAARSASQDEEAGTSRRFLIFRAGGGRYALPSEQVREIVRPPSLARVPLGPKALLGLGNLRGAVLPVAQLAGLLGVSAPLATDPRVIVLDAREPLGLLVDEVDALAAVASTTIESGGFASGAIVKGLLPASDGGEAVKLLDIDVLIARAFPATQRIASSGRMAPVRRQAQADRTASDDEILIAFEVGGQEFALPLTSVREVVPTPSSVTALPQAETALQGMIGLRGAVLPLIALRPLLGLGEAGQAGQGMTIVASVGGYVAGFAVDAVREILRVRRDALEPVPPVIAARSQGETKLQSVIKLEGGSRLVGVLSTSQLFREDVMTRIQQQSPAKAETEMRTDAAAERAILVFTLAGQEYGLAISAVEEVARLPEQVTRLPRAPAFLKGVINLRGAVLPIIDQGARFDLPEGAGETAGAARRLIVARIGGSHVGFIVDGVSEVLRVPADAVDPAPDVAGEPPVLEGVLNLEETGRMILLLDPAALLSHAEKGLLDALGGMDEAQSAVDQGARGG